MFVKWPVHIAAAQLLLSACEPRVEEPVPSSSRPTVVTAAPAVTSAAATPATAAPSARCVVPLAAEPARPKPSPAASCHEDPTGPFALDRTLIRFADASATVSAEVARRDEERQRGLMYRTALGENEGMLFVFERDKPLRFWMRNTCLPLDMLFLDAEGLVVGIEENVPTLNDDTYTVDCPARYVLEVNAGWSRRHGVAPGQRAAFDGL